MNQLEKNERIKNSTLATRERHSAMLCKVFEMKIDKSHISKTQSDFLHRLFSEAKWLYNHQLSNDNIFNISDKIKEVSVLNKDKVLETRELANLSAQMKQELIERTKQNVVALNRSKKKGNKVGSLKFKSQVNSIPLKQVNQTYRVVNTKTIKIEKCKKPFRVIGLEQLPKDCDITGAVLIHRLCDYYIMITCFVDKIPKAITNKSIGLDFGIKDNVVTSNRERFNFSFPESKQIKKASRRFNKSKKGSKNRYKRRLELSKAYLKLSNKKKDTINKFVSKLIKENDHICIQDENIHEWQSSKMKGWGRKIQYSIMGGIISKLKMSSETIIIDKFVPTTQLCPLCGTLHKHNLDQRTYACLCGYAEDRDIHSAKNILHLGLSKIPTEHRNLIPAEEIVNTSSGTNETLEVNFF